MNCEDPLAGRVSRLQLGSEHVGGEPLLSLVGGALVDRLVLLSFWRKGQGLAIDHGDHREHLFGLGLLHVASRSVPSGSFQDKAEAVSPVFRMGGTKCV